MQKMNGISASPGIVIGQVHIHRDDRLSIPENSISKEMIDSEIKRFATAREATRAELGVLAKKAEEDDNITQKELVKAHMLMLDDPEFISQVHTNLGQELKNIELIVYKTSRTIINMLKSSGDEYLMERAEDIFDVSKRILMNLMSKETVSLTDFSHEVIVVARNLLPSDTLGMDKRMVKGLAFDMGGKASHTAILARSFEIPAVLGLKTITANVNNGDILILDGNDGVVIINPDEKTLERYKKIQHKWQQRELHLLSLSELSAETKDGKLIKLQGNIEIPEEVESVLAHGADGIGLYRSEFLFMQPSSIDHEEFQFESYKKVLIGMKNKPVTIRTLDIGGDKFIPWLQGDKSEENPILGWRSIRFCLSRHDVFKAQLRALYRAGVYGNLRIMFPMISGVNELDEVLKVVEQVKYELKKDGANFNPDIPIGIMIEVPSAAMTSDILAKKVDFFSIGTNDLIQYTIAVDRGNQNIAYLYESFHPAVLRLIKLVIDNAHNAGIPVSMCGEVAGDPLATVVLLGLGLDGYSMSCFRIPEIKQIIRNISVSESEVIAGTIMEMKSHSEIEEYLRSWMNEMFDFLSIST
ncbi:MAG: phosphoenolpyruvate--protein phosphotransferase [Spirochaetales bacterium]|nr:phosphoenolpyruvate--protein phosphotransferase [Spirochaetales bacterium]